MLNKWLSEFRAQLKAAMDSSRSIAPANSALGRDACDATASVSPKNTPTAGSPEQLKPQTQASEVAMKNDILAAVTKRNLDEAIQQFMAANFDAGVLVDWFVMAETVEADLHLDNERDDHSLYVGMSDAMSRWKAFGLAQEFAKFAYAMQ